MILNPKLLDCSKCLQRLTIPVFQVCIYFSFFFHNLFSTYEKIDMQQVSTFKLCIQQCTLYTSPLSATTSNSVQSSSVRRTTLVGLLRHPTHTSGLADSRDPTNLRQTLILYLTVWVGPKIKNVPTYLLIFRS